MTAEPHLNSYIYKSLVKSNDTSPVSVCGGRWVVPGIPYILCPLESSDTSHFCHFYVDGIFFYVPIRKTAYKSYRKKNADNLV